jgi:hypothetical protein
MIPQVLNAALAVLFPATPGFAEEGSRKDNLPR